MSEHVQVERRGAVQAIRLNRPEKKNALTAAMYAAMAAALAEGEAEGAVRCHVFLGQPGAFSAGNDLIDFMAVSQGRGEVAAVWDFLEALAGAEKPIVSGADGAAVGIGTTLHLHCDLTFATPRTVFRTPFVDLGLVPEAASSLLLPAAIGHQRAFAMLALGDGLPAAAAAEAGLIHAVVEEDGLESAVFGAAETLAGKPAEALRLARRLTRPPRETVMERMREEAELFRERLRSPETAAALAAFFNRKR